MDSRLFIYVICILIFGCQNVNQGKVHTSPNPEPEAIVDPPDRSICNWVSPKIEGRNGVFSRDQLLKNEAGEKFDLKKSEKVDFAGREFWRIILSDSNGDVLFRDDGYLGFGKEWISELNIYGTDTILVENVCSIGVSGDTTPLAIHPQAGHLYFEASSHECGTQTIREFFRIPVVFLISHNGDAWEGHPYLSSIYWIDNYGLCGLKITDSDGVIILFEG